MSLAKLIKIVDNAGALIDKLEVLKRKKKEIEKKLSITRDNKIVEQMYSGDAALLHRMWRGSGNSQYLQLLVEYNEEDVINLRKIAEHVYGKLKTKESPVRN